MIQIEVTEDELLRLMNHGAIRLTSSATMGLNEGLEIAKTLAKRYGILKAYRKSGDQEACK